LTHSNTSDIVSAHGKEVAAEISGLQVFQADAEDMKFISELEKKIGLGIRRSLGWLSGVWPKSKGLRQ
jgi:hypothetical protein